MGLGKTHQVMALITAIQEQGEDSRPFIVICPTTSGKWELFKEIFRESLDSGQKVVVFSQFLGIIQMIELYMAEQNIDYVILTGSSRRRGEIIDRFNQDPDCRVYVGSLKAGGTGIDLIAASVVIHYNR